MNKFEIDLSVQSWVDFFNISCRNKDWILLFREEDDAIYFSSFFTQRLSVLGGSEVVPICGKHVNNFTQFFTQINTLMPCGFLYEPTDHGLYDILLNFETEPNFRTIIWNDAQNLLLKKPLDFEIILEQLSYSSYYNRNGLSTIKENGEPYQVNQRNIFIFVNVKKEQLFKYINKEYDVIINLSKNIHKAIKIDYVISEI